MIKNHHSLPTLHSMIPMHCPETGLCIPMAVQRAAMAKSKNTGSEWREMRQYKVGLYMYVFTQSMQGKTSPQVIQRSYDALSIEKCNHPF